MPSSQDFADLYEDDDEFVSPFEAVAELVYDADTDAFVARSDVNRPKPTHIAGGSQPNTCSGSAPFHEWLAQNPTPDTEQRYDD